MRTLLKLTLLMLTIFTIITLFGTESNKTYRDIYITK